MVNVREDRYLRRNLVKGEQPLCIAPHGYPVSPGHPLQKQINMMIGILRETHVASKMVQMLAFRRVMTEIQDMEEIKTVRKLISSDVELPFLVLVSSWIIACTLGTYPLVKKYMKHLLGISIRNITRNLGVSLTMKSKNSPSH